MEGNSNCEGKRGGKRERGMRIRQGRGLEKERRISLRREKGTVTLRNNQEKLARPKKKRKGIGGQGGGWNIEGGGENQGGKGWK